MTHTHKKTKIPKKRVKFNSLRLVLLTLALVMNTLPARSAIQNNLSSVQSTTIDKSNAPDGFIVEYGQKIGADGINGGLILFDRDNGVFRSIVNENGVMMINIDGNGDLKRILTEDDILGGNGDNLGNHTATQALDMNGFALINASLATIQALIVNENGDASNDFRVESNGDEYLIYAQAASDSVGIGTASPSALLDVGNGSIDFIDGDNDVLIGDDLEVDGTIFADNFNGGTFSGTFVGDGSQLTGTGDNLGNHKASQNIDANGYDLTNANIINSAIITNSGTITGATINGTTINATDFFGGTFNGSFVGDGSQLTGVIAAGDNLGDHIATQDLDLNGFALINATSLSVDSLVVNENGDLGNDFRVESNGDEYLIFAQANTDSVGVGTASPSALLDVGNGSVDFIDGDNDVLIGDDLEVDGTIFSDNFNGLAASITTIDATTINATNFNGGTFNGTFVGDGSGLTGVAMDNGSINNLTINNGYLQDPTINGFALFRNGGTAMFNGDVYITDGATNGFVLTTDANGLVSWQNLTELIPGGVGSDNLGNHIAEQDLDMNGFSLINVGAAVINENGDAANDFRVESNGDEYLIFAQAASDAVGIGTASPSALLDVGNGSIDFIDGADDVLIGDDLEVDGTIFAGNVNGVSANFTNIQSTNINGDTITFNTLNGSDIIAAAFKLITGAANGLVLTSDANGQASWQPAAAGGSCNSNVVLTARSFNPADETNGVSLGSNFEITFNGLVLAGTGDIRINDLDGNTTAQTISADSGNVTVNANVVTINPPSNLDYATNYAIQVDNDAFQNVMGCNEFWPGISDNGTYSFSTGAAPGIALSSSTPSVGAGSVSRTLSEFVFNFNVGLNPSIPSNGNSMEVRLVSDDSLVQDYDLSAGTLENSNTRLRITNLTTFDAGEQYYIMIDNGFLINENTPPADSFSIENNTGFRFTAFAATVNDSTEVTLLASNTNGETTTGLVPLDLDGTDTSLTQVTMTSSTIAGDSDTTITFDTVTGLPTGVTELFNAPASISFPGDAPIPNSYDNRYIIPSQEYSIYVRAGTVYLRNEEDGLGLYNTKTITIQYTNQ